MAVQSVVKQPSESRLYTMEFAALMASDETVASIVSITVTPTTTSMLTATGGVFSGTKVQFRVAAGLVNTKYKVSVVATTSAGNTIEGDGYVQLREL